MCLQMIPLQEAQAEEEDEGMEEEGRRVDSQQGQSEEQPEKDGGKKIHICPFLKSV